MLSRALVGAAAASPIQPSDMSDTKGVPRALPALSLSEDRFLHVQSPLRLTLRATESAVARPPLPMRRSVSQSTEPSRHVSEHHHIPRVAGGCDKCFAATMHTECSPLLSFRRDSTLQLRARGPFPLL